MRYFLPYEGREIALSGSKMTAEEYAMEQNRANYLKEKYKSVYVKKVNDISDLEVDANTLCYAAVEVIFARGEYKKAFLSSLRSKEINNLHKKCYELIATLIKELIDQIRPSETVTINFDGPVPLSKM